MNATSLLKRSLMPLTVPQAIDAEFLLNASFSSRATSRTAGSGRTCGAGSEIPQLGPAPPFAKEAAPGARGLATFVESQAATVSTTAASTPTAEIRITDSSDNRAGDLAAPGASRKSKGRTTAGGLSRARELPGP